MLPNSAGTFSKPHVLSHGAFFNSALYKYMYCNLITRDSTLPISLDLIKQQSNLNLADNDVLLTNYINTAIEYIEGRTGKNLVQCTWQQHQLNFGSQLPWYLSSWGSTTYYPPKKVHLIHAPLIGVVSVSYYDTSNTLQTLVEGTDYIVNKPSNLMGFIEPIGCFPQVAFRSDAVQITYTGGYVNLPYKIQQVILLLVQHWWENRGTLGDNKEIPHGVDALLGMEDSRICI